jgi:hypothetical protein
LLFSTGWNLNHLGLESATSKAAKAVARLDLEVS